MYAYVVGAKSPLKALNFFCVNYGDQKSNSTMFSTAGFLFQLEIIINVLVSSFRFI